jgi:hypothetical protein
MTSNAGPIQIAGWKTSADWLVSRQTLVVGGDTDPWKMVFQTYFWDRLQLRYLRPIQLLQQHGSFQGEGFSILAIQCSLVEFLESTLRGVSYRYVRKGDPPLGKYEYDKSKLMFVAFLRDRDPFRAEFNEDLASEFYASIRCGLLHEARTKNGWRVWAAGPPGRIVDDPNRIVYRNGFQDALDQFIAWYETALPVRTDLQEAFIRKFDDLCQ